MKDTGLEHKGCGGRFRYLPEDKEDLSCDVECDRCKLETSIATEFLGFCGCGDPDGVTRWVMRVLEFLGSEDRSYDQLKELDEMCEDRAYFILYQLAHLGLTEHGGGVAASWLSEKGRLVLEALKDKPWWEDKLECESKA